MDHETIETLEKANAAFMKMFQGSYEGLEENLQPFQELLVKHITQERERLGGDFAVASTVFSRKQRDQLRESLGPKLTFMVLNVSKECQVERLEKKHGDNPPKFTDILSKAKYAELCELAGEDEKNAFNIEITKDMTREDVIQKVLEFADKV